MKLFNINDHIAIQITQAGWEHLENTVGKSYVNHNIKESWEIINNEVWHVLQAHEVFRLLPIKHTSNLLYNPTIIIYEHNLTDLKK